MKFAVMKFAVIKKNRVRVCTKAKDHLLSINSTTDRSARRHIVLAWFRYTLLSPPEGLTKFFKGGSCTSNSSMHFSNSEVNALENFTYASLSSLEVDIGVAIAEPISNNLHCISISMLSIPLFDKAQYSLRILQINIMYHKRYPQRSYK